MTPMDLQQLDPLSRDVIESALEWYRAQGDDQLEDAEFNLVSALERYTGDVETDAQGEPTS